MRLPKFARAILSAVGASTPTAKGSVLRRDKIQVGAYAAVPDSLHDESWCLIGPGVERGVWVSMRDPYWVLSAFNWIAQTRTSNPW